MITALDDTELTALLRRCAERDRGALARLYEVVAPQLLAMLQRMLGVRAAAEDALQDSFLRIWNQAAQFDPERGRAMAWLVTIARNRAIDLKRARRPTVLLDVAEGVDAEQFKWEGPTEDSEFGSVGKALRRCLDTLGTAQRHCLLLAYQNGLSHEQISAQVSQPLGTVKSWVRRSLLNLKACMDA